LGLLEPLARMPLIFDLSLFLISLRGTLPVLELLLDLRLAAVLPALLELRDLLEVGFLDELSKAFEELFFDSDSISKFISSISILLIYSTYLDGKMTRTQKRF
jgi:hypothetical protein